MMIIIMNYHEEAGAWSNHGAYLRVPPRLVRLPGHSSPYMEEDFKAMCRAAIANVCDDIDTRVMPLNGRVKRPLYSYHSSIVRNSIAYMERLPTLIEGSIPVTAERAVYLTHP
jgi:hypothetical protein